MTRAQSQGFKKFIKGNNAAKKLSKQMHTRYRTKTRFAKAAVATAAIPLALVGTMGLVSAYALHTGDVATAATAKKVVVDLGLATLAVGAGLAISTQGQGAPKLPFSADKLQAKYSQAKRIAMKKTVKTYVRQGGDVDAVPSALRMWIK